jgi:hypothetical protein
MVFQTRLWRVWGVYGAHWSEPLWKPTPSGPLLCFSITELKDRDDIPLLLEGKT